ncbi:MAG TPA: bifunctional chorismate mutase/prephenate dehydrogenase [Candidatus Krumholzibacteria bacterium]|nr:bifunctional chorismate mutase/prephenate dehydrogenase [Candidatus Krumholzibacteria bacterium]
MSNAIQPGDDPRSLPVLRALIDAVDHDILQLLSRRNGLVAEVADYKRRHSVAIRDARREREIIADRRERSATLGLSPEVIESIFRLVLWASRDRQASLRAQVPMNIEPRTVAVIGGRGGMGRCMANLFADLGHAVMIADVDTPLTPEEAARTADVVVISVPIDITVEIVKRLAPLVREDALLMDVTSVKIAPMQAMMDASRAAVAGTHPLFGPSVHSLQGQRVALVPGRGAEWMQWLRTMLEARGLTVVDTDAATHDRVMSIVQVLTHFATEVMGSTMTALDVPLKETLRFTSPVYLMELFMTARHFAQSPDLYASIQMSNPETERITAQFLATAERLRGNVMARDHDAVRRTFSDVHTFFGDFTERAMEESSFMIDRLVERS